MQPKGAAWVFKTMLLMAVGGTTIAMAALAGLWVHYSKDLPKMITIEDYHPPAVTQVISPAVDGKPGVEKRDAVVIGEFFKERRYLVPFERVPDTVIHAFISAEDDKFFEHPGINLASIVRAAIADLRAGHSAQGGSTITQQVTRSLLLSREKTLLRKIKEIILSYRMEKNLTKQQILFLYLNQIYLGHGSYGVQAASRTYFRKDVDQISLAEAALLAGLPQAPGKYSPVLNPKRAKERQLYVLKRMAENHYISAEEMSHAGAEPLKIYHDEDLNDQYAPYLVEHIRRYLVDKYGEDAVYNDGMTVYVPTRPELAEAARKSLREGLRDVDKREGFRGALQHLKSDEEVEKFLAEIRDKMIEKKVHYQLLVADGHLDQAGALANAGVKSDLDLPEPGEPYQAVVTGFDDHRKTATVMVASIKADLPLENLKWARPLRDDRNPNAPRPEPSLPSRLLKKGDVIWVRLGAAPAGNPVPVVAFLEQEPVIQGALFSMEGQTGFVLAMEGGYDFESSEFNRAIQAQRQPGSSFKPIIYSAALERGFTPASVIIDNAMVYTDKDGVKWKPSNFEEKFYGDTTFRQALIKSRNIPTIKIVESIQVANVIQYARRLGMSAQLNADLSISLGSGATSPMEMARTYALFPRLGRRVDPIYLTKVLDRNGKILEEQKPMLLPAVVKIPPLPAPVEETGDASGAPGASPSPSLAGKGATPFKTDVVVGRVNLKLPTYPPENDPDQVLDPRVAYVMTHLMKEVVNYGTGHDAKVLGHAAAGKTGTTNDYIDAWFVGFTPDVVTSVWVGYDNQKTIGPLETGAKVALPIWLNYMKEAVKGYPDVDFNVPPGIVFVPIDATSGKLAAANSSNAIQEAFIEGTQPTQAAESQAVTPESQSEFFKEDTQ